MTFQTDNIGFIGALNSAFDADTYAPFYGFISDDEFVHTPNWDVTLVEAAGEWRVANGNDQWQSRQRVHAYVCIGGKLARAVGYLAIRQCWHWCGFDDMWEALDRRLGLRTFCADVLVEHRHFMNGKAPKDETNLMGESRGKQDGEAFARWCDDEMPSVVQRIETGKHALATP